MVGTMEIVIPATQGAEIKRIMVQGQSWQKVSKIFVSTNKLGVVVGAYIPIYSQGIITRMIVDQASLEQR
jgi:hypothetical protein